MMDVSVAITIFFVSGTIQHYISYQPYFSILTMHANAAVKYHYDHLDATIRDCSI